jgi:predicted P-loop ATPase
VFVLAGIESLGKTSWFRALCPVEGMVADGLTLDPDNKDSVMCAIKSWIVELGELESTFKRDQAKLKAFLTKKEDSIRVPYAKAHTSFQRRTVFGGSVNSEQFLKDDTDNVRYWVVRVSDVKADHGIDMQQVFAQLYRAFKGDEQWWPTPEEELEIRTNNAGHREENPMTAYLDSQYDMDSDESTWRWVSPGELVNDELSYDSIPGGNSRGQSTQLGKAMKIAIKYKYPDPNDAAKYKRRNKTGMQYKWPPKIKKKYDL